ncbi:hypothetical protein I0C86_35340 [Plantactinospora sp. S1510]|uniref:Secreted protein n=1 Tax=Plantactinospora alkalitolerans TaxID=2789879 RepID=A0ABS0H779_9ACTN|nr:hypothetical protein [Plantactinospora alkalitolerans]MBF9134174.1 hypothetical protein [Plantactinospora alkalitolerans]
MSKRHRLPVRHYRAWYFLWIFCFCGRRWRCPRTVSAPHRPGPPPAPRPALVRVPPDPPPPPPARARHTNGGPVWETATRAGHPYRTGRTRQAEYR